MNFVSRMFNSFGAKAPGEVTTQQEPEGGEAIMSIAANIGLELINRIAAEMGLPVEEAAVMAASGDRVPDSVEHISSVAAQTLVQMQTNGELNMPPEAYLSDAAFANLLREMPCRAAVKVYEAQNGANAKQERMNGAMDVIEKLRARKALPNSMRASTPVSGDRDYSEMSDAQFRQLKEMYRRAAVNGKHVSL